MGFGVGTVTQLAIDGAKDWAGNRIDNIGAPNSDDDVPRARTGDLLSGILTIARGGTGLDTIAAGAILYTAALNTLAALPPTAANQVLRSTAANALQFAALLATDIPDLDVAKITTGRFGMARLPDGTSGYVIAGQGAGLDPVYTLRKRISTGSYVGDGTTNRNIATGFQCRLVLIASDATWVVFDITLSHYYGASNSLNQSINGLAATNGFIVNISGGSGNSANVSGFTYYYCAFEV